MMNAHQDGEHIAENVDGIDTEAVVNSLSAQIAVIDAQGVIIYVNKAWRDFARDNGAPVTCTFTGGNYLDACSPVAIRDDIEGALVSNGIREVMRGKATGFSHEYPCHGPSQKRWFKMHVAPLLGKSGHFVISHVDTTSSQRQIADSRAALREIDARYQTLIERSPETIIVHRRGIIVYVNPAAVALYGAASSAALVGTPVLERVHPDSREQTRRRINDITHLGISVPLVEMRHVKLDGTSIDVEVNGGSIIFDGQPMVQTILRDITTRKLAEAAARENELRFRSLVDSTDGIVWEADAVALTNTFVSNSAERMLGYPVTDWLVPGFWESHIHPEDRDWAVDFSMSRTNRLEDHEFEYRFLASDDRVVWLRDNLKVIAENGKPKWVRGLLVDITAQKLAEQRILAGQESLRESALHTQTILDNMVDGVITINPQGLVESFNKAASTIFGYAPQEIIGHNLSVLMPEPHRSQHNGFLAHYQQTGEERIIGKTLEVEGRRKDGDVFPISLSVSRISRSGQPVFIGIVRDITRQRQDIEEIRRLAFYDSLTGLPNRRLLLDRLKHAMATSGRTSQHGAVMFLDLDHFKQLNDTLGHDLGDVLLQQVATRLTSCVREGDSVARLGGDEFVVLLEDLSVHGQEAATQCEGIALKIQDVLGQAYRLREHVYYSTPSIGIVMFMANKEPMEVLLKNADVAMYQAKSAGRNTARFFDPIMQATVAAHTELETDMRHGLASHEFALHYQIQVDIEGVIVGTEALARWNHPTRGMVSPAHFIPLAEESGLILPLGRWVLETACTQLVAWSKEAATAHWTLAVNVSASQFVQADFVTSVISAVEKAGANPYLLKLELTESILVNDVEDVIAKMNALKARGVSFSLDDFGIGYSSLSHLKRLPLAQLKIDQSFVREVLTDPSDAMIARTVVALGHSLGLKVVAEGVETVQQRDFLADVGCDTFQGYYFGRPVPAAKLLES
jgi:diguanylate cyclase (GGDEF)-like protein/PAS domain S-box-containing protein